MLSAAGMRESGAGVGIIRGSLHVGLRAFLGPPAGSISFRIAKLHAAASLVRFRAMAIASAGGDAVKHAGRVGKKRNGAGQEDKSQGEQLFDGSQRVTDSEGRNVLHERILRPVAQKTDSSGSS